MSNWYEQIIIQAETGKVLCKCDDVNNLHTEQFYEILQECLVFQNNDFKCYVYSTSAHYPAFRVRVESKYNKYKYLDWLTGFDIPKFYMVGNHLLMDDNKAKNPYTFYLNRRSGCPTMVPIEVLKFHENR